MSELTPKSWLAIGLLAALAITGSISAATHSWRVAAAAAFALLLMCGILLVTQIPRNLKINKTLIGRLEQLKQLQRQNLREATRPPSVPRELLKLSHTVPQELHKLSRKEIPQLRKRLEYAERRILSVEENTAYMAEKDALRISATLQQIQRQLEQVDQNLTSGI